MWKIFSIICFLSCFGNSEQAKLKVAVYYETLCPDSINFIKEQFSPTYADINIDFIDVDWVPYGHASESNETGTWVFTCQHGWEECFGNAMHACALANSGLKQQSIEFILCAMSADDPASLDTLELCAHKTGLSFDKIWNCYTESEYVSLLIKNGEKTRAVENTSFIPTIVINDRFDEYNQKQSLADFYNLVCDILKDEPSACK